MTPVKMKERVVCYGDLISCRTGFVDTHTPASAHENLMAIRGYRRLSHDGGSTVPDPGDTRAVPPNLSHAIEPSMSGEASLFRIRNTLDKSGLTGALL